MKPTEPGLVPEGVRSVDVVALRDGHAAASRDWVADEVPVALVFNGVSHAVMLSTPADLEDFALGFALSEGLLDGPAELRDVEIVPVADGIELRLEVAPAAEWRLRERRRTLAGRTGCGLCGTDSLATVRQPVARVEPLPVAAAAIAAGHRELRHWQAVQRLTGATHAAAWCALDGTVVLVREDVGRHNALDKLIGAMVRAGADPRRGFACITSRASFEMVQKSTRAGIAVLAAVSAPTTMAVDLAGSSGQLLAGFVRGDDLVAYTYPDRLGIVPAPHLPSHPSAD